MTNLNKALTAIMGRDVSRDVAAIADARSALGAALSVDQQIFVTREFPRLGIWLQTKEGRDMARLAVEEWQASNAKSAPPNP